MRVICECDNVSHNVLLFNTTDKVCHNALKFQQIERRGNCPVLTPTEVDEITELLVVVVVGQRLFNFHTVPGLLNWHGYLVQ